MVPPEQTLVKLLVMGKLFSLIKRLIGIKPPPSKNLTPDGKPRTDLEPEKKAEVVAPPQFGPSRYKILYVITKSNFGGAQQYVYSLATNVPHIWEPVVMCGK